MQSEQAATKEAAWRLGGAPMRLVGLLGEVAERRTSCLRRERSTTGRS